MKVSRNWLQAYFKKKLPTAKKLAELLTEYAFEIESVEKKSADEVIDVAVLPNRAHDCLSHRGIARELAAIQSLKTIETSKKVLSNLPHASVAVSIENPALCRRYIARRIKNVKVGASPSWLQERLMAIGQRPINNIVDAANFVMFDIGQPLHAFDAGQVSGTITVRPARRGETITTLDGVNIKLDQSQLVIADNDGPLAIAGVKGGTRAGVTEKTTDIILESANFSSVSVRKTARGLGLLTDAARRFENDLTPELAGEAMEHVSVLLAEIAGVKETVIEEVVDVYPRRRAPYVVGVSVEETNNLLGTKLSSDDVAAVFDRLGFGYRIAKDPIQEVLDRAQALLGTPYKYGASISYDAPREFDCSSLTAYCFAQAGVSIPRMAIDQYVFGEEVTEKNARPGDLIFSNTGRGEVRFASREFLTGTKVPEGIDHVGIYVGAGRVLHATGREVGKIVDEELQNTDRFKNTIGYRRMYSAGARFVVTIPPERLDIRIKEDLIEEIGRLSGYANIEPKEPAVRAHDLVDPVFALSAMLRHALAAAGFSEVYTYSFLEQGFGDVELANPLAEDKAFIRRNLTDGIGRAIVFNKKNLPLFESPVLAIFEIGSVVSVQTENVEAVVAIVAPSKKEKNIQKDYIEKARHIFAELGIRNVSEEILEGNEVQAIFTCDLTEAARLLGSISTVDHLLEKEKEARKFVQFSQYPFILRDIAVWTPHGTTSDGVLKIIMRHAGKLLVRHKLFDQFEKEGRVSYAFNLVFQSHESTLTDEEINKIMGKITADLNSKEGFQVR